MNGVWYADAFLTTPITYTTPATPATNIEGANENVTIQVPASKFVNGNNASLVKYIQPVKHHNRQYLGYAVWSAIAGEMTWTLHSVHLPLILHCPVVPRYCLPVYIGERPGTSGTDSSWFQSDAQKTVKLKVPGGSYQLVTSQVYITSIVCLVHFGFNHTGYLCFCRYNFTYQ